MAIRLTNTAEQQAHPEHQTLITHFFEDVAPEWKAIYERRDVFSVIHQQRYAAVLSMAEIAGIAPGTAVLEVGSGAGLMTVALAARGCHVHAMDCAKAMTALTRQVSINAGVADRVTQSLSDVNHLPLPSNRFDLVLAIGVIPWLESADVALREMARVLRPGGRLIVNADNTWRINLLLDPLSRLGMTIGGALRALGLRRQRAHSRFHSRRQFDSCIARAGLAKVESTTLGFGPFTFFRKRLLSDSLGLKVHNLLQHRADRGNPVLQRLGAQYLVLAVKPETMPHD